MILVLVVGSYPYHFSAEQTFLRPEIPYLLQEFDRVILVPERIGGTRDSLPANVLVDESLAMLVRANAHKLSILATGLRSSLVYAELIEHPRILRHFSVVKWLIGYASKSELTRQWVATFMANWQLRADELMVYTYWLEATTLGIALAKRTQPRLALVSRAHGIDLYESRHRHNYIPFRKHAVRLTDRIFPDSEAGTRYLTEHFPIFKSKFETARCGAKEPGFITQRSTDGIVRIVSCSFVVPVKRIDLLVKGIREAATRRPQLHFEWHHFGDGPLLETIVDQARTTLLQNVSSYFPGYLNPTDLMRFYREKPIDMFINVSQSEGTPLSIMEAISCGIPVIASAVGGNPEIVSEQNGCLISPDATPQEIASAIFALVDDPQVVAHKRAGSRQVWSQKYDADRNYQHFAHRLAEIRQIVS